MSERFDQLTTRHNELRLRAAIQRRELAEVSSDIRRRLGKVDRGVNIVRGLARNPLVIVGGIVVLAMLGPRRLVTLASRSALLVTTARRVLRLRRSC